MIHLGWLKWFNLKLSEKCYLSFVWPWAYTVCREHISVTLCLVGLMHKAPTKQSQHFSASYHSVHQILHALGHPDEMCCNTLVLLAQITVSINKQILILLGQNPFILYSQPIRCHIWQEVQELLTSSVPPTPRSWFLLTTQRIAACWDEGEL